MRNYELAKSKEQEAEEQKTNDIESGASLHTVGNQGALLDERPDPGNLAVTLIVANIATPLMIAGFGYMAHQLYTDKHPKEDKAEHGFLEGLVTLLLIALVFTEIKVLKETRKFVNTISEAGMFGTQSSRNPRNPNNHALLDPSGEPAQAQVQNPVTYSTHGGPAI